MEPGNPSSFGLPSKITEHHPQKKKEESKKEEN